jgi:hypothetical protein
MTGCRALACSMRITPPRSQRVTWANRSPRPAPGASPRSAGHRTARRAAESLRLRCGGGCDRDVPARTLESDLSRGARSEPRRARERRAIGWDQPVRRSPALAAIMGTLRGDGGDDLGVVDPLEINGCVTPRFVCPNWRWMTLSGSPSRASSMAWAWRGWCGANRRLTPALAATRRGCARAPSAAQGRPRVPSLDHAQQRTDRHPDAQLEPGPEVLPAPAVHADLAPAAALAVAHERGSGTRLEVVLCEPERLVDAGGRVAARVRRSSLDFGRGPDT